MKAYRISTALSLITFLLLTEIASAKQHSLFQTEPNARTTLAKELNTKSAKDRLEAQAWAKARGLEVRFEHGGVLYELAAVHNDKPLYYKTHNSNAAISTAANQVRNTAPFNVNGTGVTVGVWDGGEVLTSHVELTGRVVDKDNVSSHYHATHVGGTIGATGRYAPAKGMAPAVHIDSYDWNDDLSEMASASASAPGQTSKIYISNHSYGYGVGWEWNDSSWDFYGFEEFGQYNYISQQTDQIIYSGQYYLPFVSSGNDRGDYGSGSPAGDGTYKSGFDTISFYGIAKNCMTVGAVDDAVSGSSRSIASASMSNFSSWGPADDGRIKPDIVANGVDLWSCDNDHNSDYYMMSGTSMSSPNACGSAALLIDYFGNLFPNDAMLASTLKGLIIHTADDLGNAGPDYSSGWGLMNTLEAALLLKKYSEGSARLKEATLGKSNSDTYTFNWNGIDPIRVTLCWTDPAGTANPYTANDIRTACLVNDLDLTITAPNSTLAYPYKLDYANPANPATATGQNNIDNVEQVYIESPNVAGTYTITVRYDGSTARPATAQTYSLLISGCTEELVDSDNDGMPDEWEDDYFGSITGADPDADADHDGMNNLSEYIAGTLPNSISSVLKITTASLQNNGSEYDLNWSGTTNGRIYSVSWTDRLTKEFTPIASNLPPSQTTFTDTESRPAKQNFYRIDVELIQ